MVFTRAEHSVHALDHIDIDIEEGQFISVVGPSGCGKSTLLKLVAGLRPPTGGEIEILGEKVKGPRSDVGIVFQSPVLLPWRTVLQNVMLPIEVLRLDHSAYKAKARELLDLVGLGGFEKAYPQELSGGMQQRAAIARALVYDAPILMMDEPFGALDAMTREQMNVEVQQIWERSGKTVVFITHSIPEAVFLADRVIVMSPRPGRVLRDLHINMPRPRGLDDMLTPEFGEHVREIRGMLGKADAAGGRDDRQTNW
ncbi:MAG: ABC transporter ATP-binding protein [Salinarimonadaceae bacterium]|nr:MAG: ABC transporter ATP-binding protein [Salinarimonadaceae bacterium]